MTHRKLMQDHRPGDFFNYKNYFYFVIYNDVKFGCISYYHNEHNEIRIDIQRYYDFEESDNNYVIYT